MQNILILCGICSTVFLTNLDVSIIFISMPTFAKLFALSTSEVSWIVLIYLLSICSFVLVAGKLIDLVGAKRMFIFGSLTFLATSIGCAVSQNFSMLIAFRFCQGIGGAVLFAVSSALIVKYLPEEIRGRAFGFNTVSGALGIAVGAPAGGAILTHLSWHWIFLVNIPICLIALGLIAKYVSEETPITFDLKKFDILGAIFSLGFFSLLLFSLNMGQELGWTSPAITGCLVGAGIFFFLLLRQEVTFAEPLIDPSSLKNAHLARALLALLFAVVALNGVNFLFPFYFEKVRLFTPAKTGLILSIFPFAAMFAGPIAGILVDKLSHRLTNIVGMILALVASICFALFGADSGYLMMIASFVFFGVGMALFMTANTGLVMSHAPNGQEGAVSGMMAEGTFVGAAVGVCAFETLYSFGKNSVAINSDSATQSIASALNGHHVASILGVAAIFCALLLTLFTRSKRFAGER